MSTTPTFRVNTPSPYLTLDDKVKYIAVQINEQFDILTRWIKDATGESGQLPTFAADIDLQGHRTVNHGDPLAATDGANRRYVDERHEEQEGQIREILETLHNDLPTPNNHTIILTRVLPTTVDDIIELGSFKMGFSGHTFDLAVTVSDNGFSVAKAYTLVIQYGINADWEVALPLFDTGEYASQDFALDVKQNDGASRVFLRLRRTVGSTAGTATIQIHSRGNIADLFVESQATASVTAPVTFLESAILMVKDGNVGVKTTVVNRAATGTAVTIRGAEGDNPAHLELENPVAVASAILGSLRYYRGTEELVRAEARVGGSTDIGRWYLWTKPTGSAIAIAVVVTGNQNLILGGGGSSGSSGEKIFVIGSGTAPTTSPADSVQMFSIDEVPGNACLGIRTEAGDVLKLYTESALTASDASVVDATYGTQERDVINNLRVRVNELEARLQAHGLLA